jgi:exodeoxyribonuclease VII large subunit
MREMLSCYLGVIYDNFNAIKLNNSLKKIVGMYRNSATPTSIFDGSFEKVYSISEISNLLRGVVENHFTGITVKGELSGVKRHTSGHLYFALKDQTAVLDGVCWRGQAAKLQIQPQEGLEVVCVGRLTTYPGRSKYQMMVESMELAGEGALLKRLNDLRQKLAAEGLFDQSRKKPLPFLPQTIGVITSPTGAVIRDILHRIADRFPRHILLWPVAVQGETAAREVLQAIQGFNAMAVGGEVPKPDLLIVARGGGSLEDLWPFNEEVLVRAAAASTIPLIAAIGHETDTTLIDYAADYRAPTPTGAAEQAVPVRSHLRLQIEDLGNRLAQSIRRRLEETTQRLDERSERLGRSLMVFIQAKQDYLHRFIPRSPLNMIERYQDKFQFIATRFNTSITYHLKQHQQRLDTISTLLNSYSYNKTLERGFTLAKTNQGKVVRSATDLKSGTPFSLTFFDGTLKALVTQENVQSKDTHKRLKEEEKAPDAPQQELF